MKIGILTENFHDYRHHREFRDTLRKDVYKKIKSFGFDCADLSAMGNIKAHYFNEELSLALEWAKEEKKYADDAGIEFFQVHGPWPTDDTSPEKRAQKLVYMERAIRLTSAVGSKYIAIHPDMPYGWDHEENAAVPYYNTCEMLTKLLPIANAEGVTICIENMPMKNHELSRTKRMYEMVCDINHPNLGMCFDTGHAHVFGDDCGEMVRLIAPVLKILHVHDNMGDKDTHLRPLTGTIDFESFIHALRDIGYDGCFSIESVLSRKMDDPTYDTGMNKMFEAAKAVLNMP